MCCLFGFVDYKGTMSKAEKDRLVHILSIECELRGTDATGIAYYQGKNLHIVKKPKAARDIRFSIPANVRAVMGHTRMATQGEPEKNYNNHPFEGKLSDGRKFAFAHNGVLYNEDDLRLQYDLPDTKIQTDSYVVAQALESIGRVDFDSLGEVSHEVLGSFCFTTLTPDNALYIVKGDNPMCLYDLTKKGVFVYASTKEILDAALKRLGMTGVKKREIILTDGQIIKLNMDGKTECAEFEMPVEPLWYRSYYTSAPAVSKYDFEDNGYAEYYESIVDFAESLGFTEDDVKYMRHCGYTLEDVEDYLYDVTYYHRGRYTDLVPMYM